MAPPINNDGLSADWSRNARYRSPTQTPYPFSASSRPLIFAFRTLDGLNTITLRGRMGTSTPVFGLRPTRSPLERTTKEPKPDSLTVSPRAAASQISSRTDWTSSADSVRYDSIF